MKPGDIVKSTVNIQPLTSGMQGTVKKVDNSKPFPVVVYFPSVDATLPMKYAEIRKVN